MSGSAADAGWSNARSAAGRRNPWLIAGILSIATFMEVLDTSIANVALVHIAGSLATSIDETTWVLTSYLVANAVILPVSGWLSNYFGRKNFYMFSVALFTASSLVCGFAPNLIVLIVARVFQGLGGGGLAPSEQSMLADSFPPSKRTQAFALYGVAVIVAPALGPTIGGWITDNVSWHWIFFLNVPVGLASLALVHLFVEEPKALVEERKEMRKSRAKVDWVGFVLVALFLGCLEIVLDKGQEDDWFSSNFITFFAVLSGLSLAAFVPWELTRRDPIVEIRLLGRRQFGASWIVMLAVGMILFSSTQFVPQLLQENYGYTATLAGLALMPGGLAAFGMMVVAGRVSAFLQPRLMLAGAMLAIALSMWHFTTLSPDADFRWFAWRARPADGGAAVSVPDRDEQFLCRPSAGEIGAGFGPHQCGAQPRRQHWRLRDADAIGAPRAIPSVAPRRASDVFVVRLPRYASTSGRIFQGAWRLCRRLAKPGRRVGGKDSRQSIDVSGLHRRLRDDRRPSRRDDPGFVPAAARRSRQTACGTLEKDALNRKRPHPSALPQARRGVDTLRPLAGEGGAKRRMRAGDASAQAPNVAEFVDADELHIMTSKCPRERGHF